MDHHQLTKGDKQERHLRDKSQPARPTHTLNIDSSVSHYPGPAKRYPPNNRHRKSDLLSSLLDVLGLHIQGLHIQGLHIQGLHLTISLDTYIPF